MKFVKVTAMAAAMAASFGAIAEMAALDDADLEAVTGQAGITIEQTIGGLDIYYLDGDGFDTDPATAGTQATHGGVLKIGGLQTVAINDATGVVTTGSTSIKMEIDVTDNTTATADLDGGALRIKQTLATSTASASGALKIASIQIGGTATTAQSDDAFTAGFANILDTGAGNAAASIGSVYVTGLDVDMFIYAH